MKKLVYGVGINDGKYPASIGSVNIKEYGLWKGMLERCYNTKDSKILITYKDCFVSENFKNYSYFYEWCQNQIGFKNDGWQLDKDLLIKGNKFYSEDTCLFLPKEINVLLTKRENDRGNYPVGVYFEKKPQRFRAQISMFGKRHFLGYFDSSIEAFEAYKVEKEKHIKYIANKHRDFIDDRAYSALMNYVVEIND